MPDTKFLSLCLSDHIATDGCLEVELPVKYRWSGSYRPARLHPWPGDPEEWPELEILTPVEDLLTICWAEYQAAPADGLTRPLTRGEFDAVIRPVIEALIEAEDFAD